MAGGQNACFKARLLDYLRERKASHLREQVQPCCKKSLKKKLQDVEKAIRALTQYAGAVQSEGDVDGIAGLTNQDMKKMLKKGLQEIQEIDALMPPLYSGAHAILVTLLRADTALEIKELTRQAEASRLSRLSFFGWPNAYGDMSKLETKDKKTRLVERKKVGTVWTPTPQGFNRTAGSRDVLSLTPLGERVAKRLVVLVQPAAQAAPCASELHRGQGAAAGQSNAPEKGTRVPRAPQTGGSLQPLASTPGVPKTSATQVGPAKAEKRASAKRTYVDLVGGDEEGEKSVTFSETPRSISSSLQTPSSVKRSSGLQQRRRSLGGESSIGGSGYWHENQFGRSQPASFGAKSFNSELQGSELGGAGAFGGGFRPRKRGTETFEMRARCAEAADQRAQATGAKRALFPEFTTRTTRSRLERSESIERVTLNAGSFGVAGEEYGPSDERILLLADHRERRHVEKRNILLDGLIREHEGTGVEVVQKSLELADYILVQEKGGEMYLLGTIVERKTMNDLVARSSKADHLRQFEHMRRSGMENPIILIEGSIGTASFFANQFKGEWQEETEAIKSASSTIDTNDKAVRMMAQIVMGQLRQDLNLSKGSQPSAPRMRFLPETQGSKDTCQLLAQVSTVVAKMHRDAATVGRVDKLYPILKDFQDACRDRRRQSRIMRAVEQGSEEKTQTEWWEDLEPQSKRAKLGAKQDEPIVLEDEESSGRQLQKSLPKQTGVHGTCPVLYVTEEAYEVLASAAEPTFGHVEVCAFSAGESASNFEHSVSGKTSMSLLAVPGISQESGAVDLGEREAASVWTVVMSRYDFIVRLLNCQLEAVKGQGLEAFSKPIEDEHIQMAVALFVSSLPLPEERALEAACTSALSKVCVIESSRQSSRALTQLRTEVEAPPSVNAGGIAGLDILITLNRLEYYGTRGGVLDHLFRAWVAYLVVQQKWSVLSLNTKESKRFLIHLAEACFTQDAK